MEKVIINYKMQDNDSKIEYKTVGKFNVETDFIYLEFIEKDTNNNAVYKMYGDFLLLERKGSIYMQAEFNNKTITSCKFITDFNYEANVNVNTFLYNINYDEHSNIYKLELIYELEIDKGNKHHLILEIKNKNISIAKK